MPAAPRWSPAEASADDDAPSTDLAGPPAAPRSAFAQKSVASADGFVLSKLAGHKEAPSQAAVPGELDALSLAMGALWELAAESDVNQARLVSKR